MRSHRSVATREGRNVVTRALSLSCLGVLLAGSPAAAVAMAQPGACDCRAEATRLTEAEGRVRDLERRLAEIERALDANTEQEQRTRAAREPFEREFDRQLGDGPGTGTGAFVQIDGIEVRYGTGGRVEMYQQGQLVPRNHPASPYMTRLRDEMDAADARLKELAEERAELEWQRGEARREIAEAERDAAARRRELDECLRGCQGSADDAEPPAAGDVAEPSVRIESVLSISPDGLPWPVEEQVGAPTSKDMADISDVVARRLSQQLLDLLPPLFTPENTGGASITDLPPPRSDRLLELVPSLLNPAPQSPRGAGDPAGTPAESDDEDDDATEEHGLATPRTVEQYVRALLESELGPPATSTSGREFRLTTAPIEFRGPAGSESQTPIGVVEEIRPHSGGAGSWRMAQGLSVESGFSHNWQWSQTDGTQRVTFESPRLEILTPGGFDWAAGAVEPTFLEEFVEAQRQSPQGRLGTSASVTLVTGPGPNEFHGAAWPDPGGYRRRVLGEAGGTARELSLLLARGGWPVQGSFGRPPGFQAQSPLRVGANPTLNAINEVGLSQSPSLLYGSRLSASSIANIAPLPIGLQGTGRLESALGGWRHRSAQPWAFYPAAGFGQAQDQGGFLRRVFGEPAAMPPVGPQGYEPAFYNLGRGPTTQDRYGLVKKLAEVTDPTQRETQTPGSLSFRSDYVLDGTWASPAVDGRSHGFPGLYAGHAAALSLLSQAVALATAGHTAVVTEERPSFPSAGNDPTGFLDTLPGQSGFLNVASSGALAPIASAPASAPELPTDDGYQLIILTFVNAAVGAERRDEDARMRSLPPGRPAQVVPRASASWSYRNAQRTAGGLRQASYAAASTASGRRREAQLRTPAAGEPLVSVVATGASSGEVFELQVLNPSDEPLQIASPEGLVLQPIRRGAARPVAETAGRPVATTRLTGYCLDYAKPPPPAGMLYQVAPEPVQQRYRSMRRLLEAGRSLAQAGVLNPDSEAGAYATFISQWALWTKQHGWDLPAFTREFIDRTRKNLASMGRPWSPDAEALLEQVAPNRFADILAVLLEAEALERRETVDR
jgi:hypothetical protein